MFTDNRCQACDAWSKLDTDGGAFVDTAVGRQASAVHLGQATRDRQSDAGPTAVSLANKATIDPR